MKARLILKKKEVWADGTIIEIVIWELPEPTRDRPHGFKYRLFCGRGGKCIVRYDNESGKGDHKHVGPLETDYTFVSLEKLLDDFQKDFRRLIGGKKNGE